MGNIPTFFLNTGELSQRQGSPTIPRQREFIMKIKGLYAHLPIFCGLVLTLGSATAASAQTTARRASTDEARVERTAKDLQIDLRDAIRRDVDTADTALVFNAPGPNHAVVYCRGYDADGKMVGRTATKVPRFGLRYIRASDLANGLDFVGSAFCSARG